MFIAVSNPPALPAFLASKYDLKPITSPPTDDELKSIHAAIRAANDASKLGELFPELNCSVNLVSDLKDYLFDAQMARYRSTHGFILSPKDLVYRPPALPDHIANTVALQPITGPPSDGELKLVALANRTCEGFSNTSLFDAELEMNLSQHLFDLRLARYAQRMTGIHNRTPSYDLKQNIDTSGELVDRGANQQAQPSPLQSCGDSPKASVSIPSNTDADGSNNKGLSFGISSVQGSRPCLDPTLNNTGTHPCNMSGALGKIIECFETMNKVLVSTQNSHACVHNWKLDSNLPLQEMVNRQGELPSNKGLALLEKGYHGGLYDPGDRTLAQYLRFYDIGSQFLIPDSNNPSLIPEKKADALDTLCNWVTLHKYLD